MSSRPILARIIVVFGALLAVIVAVCGAVIYLAGQRAVRAQQVADLERLTPLVRQWVLESTSPPPGLDPATAARLAAGAKALDTRVTLIAGDGHVVIDTWADPATMANHNDRPEVLAARKMGRGESVRRSPTIDEDSVYVAEPIDLAKPDGLIVRLSFPQRTWAKADVPVWQVVGGGMLAAVLAVGVLWSVLQRRWILPTRRLIAAAEQMAAGDWNARVDPAGADELQFFSTRLNLVALHAQRQLGDLRHQRADLQALVDTLPDPVLATDDAGEVILINLPAARLLALSRSRALGRNVVNVVNDDAVLQLFERAKPAPADAEGRRLSSRAPDGGSSIDFHDVADTRDALALADADNAPPPLTREIRLNRDGQWLTFQAVAKPTAGGGVLMVLRDVTALAAAVQMKTDFVANASHELRTPIAAIKIAFETLREVYDDDAAQSDRCMQIIEGHLWRLEEMLRDLLDLSRVENPNLKPVVKRLHTLDVMTHVRSSLGPMARQKGVTLRLVEGLGVDPAIPADFVSDERLLQLILKNLVENSVKFTPAGGSVSISLRRDQASEDGSTVLLQVADTGIGIPPEHLDRVFERFYQVDSVRSGSAGRGTGLGLAIVKHAVNALNGTVQVESEVGAGTTVTCALPQTTPESWVEPTDAMT